MIVESPSKCKKIEQYLREISPHPWACLATVGHLRVLKKLSIRDFKPEYAVDNKKRKTMALLKTTLARVSLDRIAVATDDDREGEAIAWHLAVVMEWPLDKVRRIVFHEITKPALEEALASPRALDLDWVVSQQTRQAIDRLVGYKVSPVLWRYTTKSETLSAGRCQTPALRLISENAAAVAAAAAELPTPYYTPQARFQLVAAAAAAAAEYWFDYAGRLSNEADLSDCIARTVAPTPAWNLHMGLPWEQTVPAPTPFCTSSLLQQAIRAFHWSSHKTMKVCQELYQEGHITYIRTMSTQYSRVFVDQARRYVSQKYGAPAAGGGGGCAAGAHEAIRVTNCTIETLREGTPDAKKLYRFIWKHTIQSCMAAGVDDIYKVVLSRGDDKWIHTIVICKTPGWRQVDGDTSGKAARDELMFFKTAAAGAAVAAVAAPAILPEKKVVHYTEGTLIKKLVELEIGRPSTFTTIVQTLVERKYVEPDTLVPGQPVSIVDYQWAPATGLRRQARIEAWGEEKNKWVLTPLGRQTVEFLIHGFDSLFSYQYTQEMERKLDSVRGQESDMVSLCRECVALIKQGEKTVKTVCAPIVIEPGWELRGWGDNSFLYECATDQTHPIHPAVAVDRDRACAGAYKLADLLFGDFGEYYGLPLCMKKGPYGWYAQWGDKKQAVPAGWNVPATTAGDLQALFMNKGSGGGAAGGGARILTPELSIRQNKKTLKPYIFYQTAEMNKPRFFPLRGKWRKQYTDCDTQALVDWIVKTYIAAGAL
jgi:DNA topoisomerase-1